MHLHPSFATLFPSKPFQAPPTKGGGAPTDAPSIGRISGCGSGLIGDRSPLGAPPRRLPRKLMPWLSPGRVSWDLRAAGVSRRALSQSSEAPRRPVIMPADAMPGPPGSGVTSPARRNRTRSTSRMSREYLVLRRLFRRRISRGRPAGRRGRRRGARRRTAAMERAQRIRPNRAGPLAEQSLPQAKLAA